MKRKRVILLLLFSIIVFITAVLVVNKNSGIKQPETSIRNASKQPITYWIIEEGSEEESRQKTLRIGELHRYPSGIKYEVTFKSGDETVGILLDPNTPYSFRYDQDDLLSIYPGSHGRSDAEDLAPFVATPMEIVEKMLAMVKIGKNDVLYDLGCGDGRIVIAAAQKYKVRGVGIDIDPQRIRECKEKARIAGVKNLVTFVEKDVFKVDISTATVVTIYLLPDSNELLRPYLERQLKPGVYVISHNYPIPGWDAKKTDYQECNDKEGEIHLLYQYRR